MRFITRTLAIALAASLFLGACEKEKAPDTKPTPDVAKTATDSPKTPPKGDEAAAEANATADEGQLGEGTQAQQDLLLVAKSAFLKNQWEEAAVSFEALTKTGPVSGPQVTAYIALGEIYRENGETKKAMALYEELLKKAPKVAEVQFVVGRAFAEEGETTRAIKAYEHTVTLQPDYLQAYVELGTLYTKAGREEEAQKVFLRYEKRIYSLAQRLENPEIEPTEHLSVLEIFSFVQDDRANQAIVSALKSPHPRVREKAIALIEDLRIGGAVEAVKALAENDPDLRVRMIAKAATESLTGIPADGSKPTFVDDPSKLPVKN